MRNSNGRRFPLKQQNLTAFFRTVYPLYFTGNIADSTAVYRKPRKNPALVETELGNRENDDDANSEDDGGYGAFFAICQVKYFILQ